MHGQKWNGSINYERVVKYLPHFRSAIQVPVCIPGIDVKSDTLACSALFSVRIVT